MEIDENYSIAKDGDGVILKYEDTYYSEEKKKVVKSKDHLYYPNVKMALKKYINLKVDNCSNLERIVAEIRRLEVKIDSLKL